MTQEVQQGFQQLPQLAPAEKPSLEQYYKTRYPRHHLAAHTKEVLAELEGLNEGEALILNLPPRHGKTDCLSAFIELELGTNEYYTVIYATYGATLTEAVSRQIRNTIDGDPAFRHYFPHVHLSEDARAIRKWATTTNSEFIPTSLKGSITGKGGKANLVVIDDPLKSIDDAYSRQKRDAIIRWMLSDLFTRLNPRTKLIFNQTRWHKEDPCGFVLKASERDPEYRGMVEWKTLVMPALNEQGEALWPEEYPAKWLIKQRDDPDRKGPNTFPALYQQNPTSEEDLLFENIFYYDELPVGGYAKAIAVDFAYSKTTRADYTAIVVGRRYKGNIYVTDLFHFKEKIRTAAGKLKSIQEHEDCLAYTRVGGQEKPIAELLEDRGLRITPIKTTGDKLTNAQGLAHDWNAGMILIPSDAKWKQTLVDEVIGFTGAGDEHDDIVDALVTLNNALRKPVTQRGFMSTGLQITGEGSLEDFSFEGY